MQQNSPDPDPDPSPLRAAAEARLALNATGAEQPRTTEELLHELQVHQIELEMQNEELRQAQVALAESRDSYVDLYEFAPVGYLTLTARGLISKINLTCAILLGEDRKKLLNRRFARHIAPEDSDRWHRLFTHALRHGGIYNCEVAIQREDGSRFQARLDYQCREGDATSILRITLTDISARKQAEQDLRIAAIAFESQSGVFVTDTNAVILRVNRAFTTLTGYSADEALGRTPRLLSSGRHDRAFYRSMWGRLLETGYWQGEIWNRRKDGHVYAQWQTVSAVTGPDGCISHYVCTFSDVTKAKEAADEIHQLAYYDSLTFLPNRRMLQDRLRQALVAATHSEQYGAILFIDLDNFKTLNDTRGHDIGDALLVQVAQRLCGVVRECDTVARLGGDEFVILLENLNKDASHAAAQANLVGEKLVALFNRHYRLTDYEYHCTCSIGISLFSGDDSAEELLKHADLALYQAKAAGRNTLRFFDPEMQADLDRRSALENDLRQALLHEQFQLYYQPQIDAAHRIVGVEALLRWLHPQRGLVLPDEFIPIAEDSGLILPIGQWVLQTACAQLKCWQNDALASQLQLAINVSALEFRQDNFADQVRETLQRSGANPARLKLELTESVVLDNVDSAIKKMQLLNALGVGFSMDDFGTGYSSLSYLARLPLDQIKVDKSFVLNLPGNHSDEIIAQTVVTMGGSLGLNVIAEGVETVEQHAFLDMHGCHAYQGYLFSSPLPLHELEQFLKRH